MKISLSLLCLPDVLRFRTNVIDDDVEIYIHTRSSSSSSEEINIYIYSNFYSL